MFQFGFEWRASSECFQNKWCPCQYQSCPPPPPRQRLDHTVLYNCRGSLTDSGIQSNQSNVWDVWLFKQLPVSRSKVFGGLWLAGSDVKTAWTRRPDTAEPLKIWFYFSAVCFSEDHLHLSLLSCALKINRRTSRSGFVLTDETRELKRAFYNIGAMFSRRRLVIEGDRDKAGVAACQDPGDPAKPLALLFSSPAMLWHVWLANMWHSVLRCTTWLKVAEPDTEPDLWLKKKKKHA